MYAAHSLVSSRLKLPKPKPRPLTLVLSYLFRLQIPRNPLQGKEVTLQASMQRSASSRFSAVAMFPLQQSAARKREHMEFAPTHPGEPAVDVHRTKRQRVSDEGGAAGEPLPSLSLTERLANWLLPSPRATPAAPPPASNPFGSAPASASSVSTYPFKQPLAQDKRRGMKRNSVGARSKLQKTPSAMQSFEQWLFKDPENTTPN